MDDFGTRYLFYRDKSYLESHCDLNVPTSIMAERLIEGYLVKMDSEVDLLPRIRHRHESAMTATSLAKQYDCSIDCVRNMLGRRTYTEPRPQHENRDDIFTFEEAEKIREQYHRVHPPKKPRKKRRRKRKPAV